MKDEFVFLVHESHCHIPSRAQLLGLEICTIGRGFASEEHSVGLGERSNAGREGIRQQVPAILAGYSLLQASIR